MQVAWVFKLIVRNSLKEKDPGGIGVRVKNLKQFHQA